MIEWESKGSLSWKENKVYIGDKQVRQYRFQSNYYFVAGDKTENSRDSRYLGLIPGGIYRRGSLESVEIC